MELSSAQLYAYGRPVAFPYALITRGSAPFKCGRGGFSVKEDGWKLIYACDDLWQCGLFTKNGHELLESGVPMLRAVGEHFYKHYAEKLYPFLCLLHKRFRASALHLEFVARKRYPSGEVRSCLEDLLSGACIKDGKLDTESYTYTVKIFDAVFENAKGSLRRFEWYERIECIIDTYGSEFAVKVINTVADFRHALLHEEGVVGHELYEAVKPPKIIKIKMPKIPVCVEIAGVKSTLPDSEIWNMIYLCVNGPDPKIKHAVVVYDYTAMFTHGSDSKVHVNPNSVKRSGDGAVTCTSSTVMGPILNALFSEISKCKLYSAGFVTPTLARVRDGVRIVCGPARKYKLDAGIQFLDPMPKITVGANKCWLNSDGSVHLQAPALLSTSSYGMQQYQELPVTSVGTLESIAREQPEVGSVYHFVGMKAGPLDDLAPMSPLSFTT